MAITSEFVHTVYYFRRDHHFKNFDWLAKPRQLAVSHCRPTGPANNTSSHWTEAFNGYGPRPAGWRTPGNRGAGLGRASCRRSECGRAGLAGVARRGRPTQDLRTNGSTRGGQPEKRGADGRVGLHNAGGLAGPTQGGLSERKNQRQKGLQFYAPAMRPQ
jgi:hypothetical protein